MKVLFTSILLSIIFGFTNDFLDNLEPNNNLHSATYAGGMYYDKYTPILDIKSTLSNSKDIDIYSTWLGFDFWWPSQWGTPLTVVGNGYLSVTGIQVNPLGQIYSLSHKEGIDIVSWSGPNKFVFEHYPLHIRNSFFIIIRGSSQQYNIFIPKTDSTPQGLVLRSTLDELEKYRPIVLEPQPLDPL